ncbi:MAG: PAS domain S-box protein, partial [Desulfobacterales bacterium]|nr:PAS domain S-box protein [Desulfobacterales bacterium]
MKTAKKDNRKHCRLVCGEKHGPDEAPRLDEITKSAEELSSALERVDWKSHGIENGWKASHSHSLQRFHDAISALKRRLDPFFGKRARAERINNVLFRISGAVNASSNLDELYQSIHLSLGDILDVSNFYIALYDEKEDRLSFPYHVDEKTQSPTSALDNPRVNESASLTSRIIKTGRPIFIKKDQFIKLYETEGSDPSGVAPEVWMGVPLTAGENVIGAMVVQSYLDSELYNEKDVDLLAAISGQAAIAIQRKRAEEALRVEKAHTERLFEEVQEGVVMTDARGVVLNVNPEFTRMFGYTGEEAAGSLLEDLIALPDRSEETREFTRRIAAGEKVAFNAWRKRKDGARIHVSVIGASIPLDADAPGQYKIYRDVTAQTRADSILPALYNIAKAVNSTHGLDQLFELIHRSLGAIIDVSNFYIALYDEIKDVITFSYQVDERDNVLPIYQASRKWNALTPRVIFKNKALFFDEAMIRRMYETGKVTLGSVAKVWMGVPLSIKGKVIGAVVVQSYTDPNLYSEKDIRLLESVSEQIAIAIDQKRTEEALSESERMHRMLFDNAGDAIFVHDMGRVFLDVNAAACERYGSTREELLKMIAADLVARERRSGAAVRVEMIRQLGQYISET